MPKITLSVQYIFNGEEQSHFSELDLAPTTTLKDFKQTVLVGVLPQAYGRHAWFVRSKGQDISTEDASTLNQLGIEDGDILEANPTPQQEQPPPASQRPPQNPEMLRRAILNNEEQRRLLQERFPALAQQLHNPEMFRQLLEDIQRGEGGSAGDEQSPEEQERILKMIQRSAVQQELEAVMESTPEALGRVTMLYIQLHVNGHPVKAFVDSGAQATIISPSCAEACGITRLIDDRWAGVARGVGTAKILGRIHRAMIRITYPIDKRKVQRVDPVTKKEHEVDEDVTSSDDLECAFTVMEGKDVDMLLGLDMLKRYQACIDLRKNCLRFPDGQEVAFLGESDIPKGFDVAEAEAQSQAQNHPPQSVPGPAGAGVDRPLRLPPELLSGLTGSAGRSTAASTGGSASSAGNAFAGLGRTLGSSSGPAPAPASAGPASAARSSQQQQAPAAQPAARPPAPTPAVGAPSFPQASIDALQGMGMTREQAIEALRATDGNVEMAAALLFD